MTGAGRIRSLVRRAGRWLVYGLLLAVGLYLVGRAVLELVTVDPARPETYRQDWGGPSYLGVLLVHVGPGVLAVLMTALWVRRRHRVRTAGCSERSTGDATGDR